MNCIYFYTVRSAGQRSCVNRPQLSYNSFNRCLQIERFRWPNWVKFNCIDKPVRLYSICSTQSTMYCTTELLGTSSVWPNRVYTEYTCLHETIAWLIYSEANSLAQLMVCRQTRLTTSHDYEMHCNWIARRRFSLRDFSWRSICKKKPSEYASYCFIY